MKKPIDVTSLPRFLPELIEFLQLRNRIEGKAIVQNFKKTCDKLKCETIISYSPKKGRMSFKELCGFTQEVFEKI